MGERANLTGKTTEPNKTTSIPERKNTISHKSRRSPVEEVLFLQRAIGNMGVERLFKSGLIQAKLEISQPGDIYEQEADRVADEVMRMPDTRVTRFSHGDTNIRRRCLGCASGNELCTECGDEEGGMIQRKSETTHDVEADPVPVGLLQSLGSGKPLDIVTREFFEPRFGYDFSQVRVHNDTRAAESAISIYAKAFTIGRDIVFGKDEYSPNSSDGKRLLAHELTHVVQQDRSGFVQRQVFVPESEPEEPSNGFDSDNVNIIKPGESIPVIWFNRGTLVKRSDEFVNSLRNMGVLIESILRHLEVVGLDADIKFKGYISNAESELDSGLSQRRAAAVRDHIIDVFNSVDTKLKYKFSYRSEAIGMGVDDTFEGDEWNQRVDVELLPPWSIQEFPEMEISDLLVSSSILGGVTVEDCPTGTKQLMETVLKSAFTRVQWAIIECEKDPAPKIVIDGLGEFFNASASVLPDVISTLKTISREFLSHHVYECEESGFWFCTSKTSAYVRLIGSTVHLCPTFFGLKFEGQNNVIIHELGHVSADLSDELYYKDAGWDSRYPEELLNNADSFSQFVMFVTAA